MAHANARTNLFGRRLMVERVAAGWPAARVAEQLGASRATVYKWLRRHAMGGDAALGDRSSRPVAMPCRTPKRIEPRVLAARKRRQRGAVALAAELGLNPSAVGRILKRHDARICARSIRSPASRSALRGATKTVMNTRRLVRWFTSMSRNSARFPRWRLATTQSGGGDLGRVPAQEHHDRLRLRAHRHRRLHPAGLQRGAGG